MNIGAPELLILLIAVIPVAILVLVLWLVFAPSRREGRGG